MSHDGAPRVRPSILRHLDELRAGRLRTGAATLGFGVERLRRSGRQSVQASLIGAACCSVLEAGISLIVVRVQHQLSAKRNWSR
jgi:hypothetical protein